MNDSKIRFRELESKIDLIADKDTALTQIKQKIWPLDSKDKDSWFYEYGEDEKVKDLDKTRELSHYIKQYLQRLLNL